MASPTKPYSVDAHMPDIWIVRPPFDSHNNRSADCDSRNRPLHRFNYGLSVVLGRRAFRFRLEYDGRLVDTAAFSPSMEAHQAKITETAARQIVINGICDPPPARIFRLNSSISRLNVDFELWSRSSM